MTAALETIRLSKSVYDRTTEWRRDVTIPWDLAHVCGKLVEDIGPNLKAGTVIFSGSLTRQAWAELKSRAI